MLQSIALKCALILGLLATLGLSSRREHLPSSKLKRHTDPNSAKLHTWAMLYENADKEGAKFSFRDSVDGWANINKVLKKYGKKKNPELLCASGSWLIYDKIDFQISEGSTVRFLSGDEICVKPDDSIASLQPSSAHYFTSEGSIALFSKANYSSTAIAVSADESKKAGIKQLDEPVSPLGSIIVTGEGEWSLVSATGDVVCVRPQPGGSIKNSMSVCYHSNLLKIHIQDFQVNAIFPDCPREGDKSIVANLRLTDCTEYESGEIVPLRSSTISGRTLDENKVSLECRPKYQFNLTKFTPEEADLIKKLINLRLTHDFNSNEQLLWPENSEDIWKTSAMDLAFDIVLATAPSSVINTYYLKILREFTIFHLNEVWVSKNSTEANGRRRLNQWKNHKTINHLLQKCLILVEKNSNYYNTLISSSYNQRRTLEDFESKIDPALTLKMENDPIIETAWLVANYVMGACHQAFGYQVNFWDNFVTTFRHLYFIPLLNRWTKPTQIAPRIFRVILSGFGTVSEYKRLAFSASMLLKLTPNLQPFERYIEA